jgi:hypothetical protein
MTVMRFNNADGLPTLRANNGQTASDWVLRQVSLHIYSNRVIPPVSGPHAAAL